MREVDLGRVPSRKEAVEKVRREYSCSRVKGEVGARVRRPGRISMIRN